MSDVFTQNRDEVVGAYKLAIFGEVLNRNELNEWVAKKQAKGLDINYEDLLGVVPTMLAHDKEGQEPSSARFITDDGKYMAEHRWQPDQSLITDGSFSHVVLFAGPAKPDVPRAFYFNALPITGKFVIVTYDEKTDTYKHIHCPVCASVILQWLMEMQQEWTNADKSEGATHVAPASLQ